MKRWVKKESLLRTSLLLVLISACSYFNPINEGLKTSHEDPFFVKELQNDLNRLCFNSEGKGRVQVLDQKYLFSFESLHVPKDSLWKLAIDLPMAGQELLEFRYKDVESNKLRVGGSFYQRIKLNNNKDWKVVLTLLGRFFKWMDDNRSGDLSAKCIRGERSLEGECTFSDGSAIRFNLDKNLTLMVKRNQKVFTLKTQDESPDGYFKKMSFTLKRDHDFGPRGMQFRLDLFLDSCSEPIKYLVP